ncbi:DNA polymerase III subunit alpha [Flavobacteriaceae bacterium]|nr:DNA polymerase III subunit alpha [Flavobacteriaceae bacterium]
MYLNTHTAFSLRYGLMPPRVLLERISALGITHFAVTDINNTSVSLELLQLAPKYNCQLSVGVDFRNGAQQQYIMLAQSSAGFAAINRHLSEHLHCGKPFEVMAPELPETLVIYPFDPLRHSTAAPQRPNSYIGVHHRDLNKVYYRFGTEPPECFVALHTISFRGSADFNTHRLLRAIDGNTLLSKLCKSEQGHPEDLLLSPEQLKEYYAGMPVLLERAQKLLESCHIDMDLVDPKPKNQSTYTNNPALDLKLLDVLIKKGLRYRFGEQPEQKVLERLKKEREIIRQKGFVAYFLINWKILRYARSKGYFYVGRGSGANSLIAYLLRITDVDPIDLDLYFERFINLYRTNPPDFDLDFSWTDRDDVTAYIFKRFKHTALIAVYNTFKHRAAVRELGKVFGLPKTEIDRLSRGSYRYEDLDHRAQYVVRYSKRLIGLPNYLGIHAGGILIAEQPIAQYTATFLPPKGYPTTHFDMVVAENIGLYKFDILSQRGLGKIKDAVGIIRQNHPDQPPIDIHDLKRFKQDPKIKVLLREARAMGCFYVESPAMRMLLHKLQVDHYLGLVAASSIIRPGVSQSGMMREYILRYRYPERRAQAHPVLQDIMPETYGVMVYQEDVIKVAHYFGGLNLGEADMLRRGMSGKYRSKEEFLKVKNQFFDNCARDGKPLDLVEDIWRQIESFAGYAFAKGHSASYAVESYQSLFLKAHYPIEYMVATINNGGGFYRPEFYLHEARMHGAEICPPCINTSRAETIVKGCRIYLGLGLLYALEHNLIRHLLHERDQSGAFGDLDDFMDRIPIGLESLILLIKIDAFRFTGVAQRALLWQAHMKLKKQERDGLGARRGSQRGQNTGSDTTLASYGQQQRLFRPKTVHYVIPPLEYSALEQAFDQIELLGYTLCDPFLLLQHPPQSSLMADQLQDHESKMVLIYGYLVTTKPTKTSKGAVMYFGTFLDRKGVFFDTVHFPPVAQRWPFRGRGVYAVSGKVVTEFDCTTIEVTRMEIQPIIQDPRYAEDQVQARLASKHYKNKLSSNYKNQNHPDQ